MLHTYIGCDDPGVIAIAEVSEFYSALVHQVHCGSRQVIEIARREDDSLASNVMNRGAQT
jgi:hypothetical protein